jgi:hypothetical protein
VLACAAKPEVAWQTVTPAGAGFSASMPERWQQRRVREGPAIAHIVWGVDEHDGAYEVARFTLPEAPDEAARAALMKTVRAGIGGAPGRTVIGERTVSVSGREALELVIDLPDDRRGTWWILWADDRTMVQASAMGPRGAALDAGTRRFSSSLKLYSPTTSPMP